MRTLMTLLTLGAAGAGYAYLQQSPVPGEPYSARRPERSLSDWNRDPVSKIGPSRVSVKDLVTGVHEHTKSILDDFVKRHGGHSDAPADDAFQRLRQVTQSAVTSSASDGHAPIRDVTEWAVRSPRDANSTSSMSRGNHARLVPANLDDLQRTAFDRAVVVESLSDATTGTGPARDVVERVDPQTQTAPPERASAIQVVAGNLEPTQSMSPRDVAPTNDAERSAPPISHVSQANVNAAAKRATTPAAIATTATNSVAKITVGEWKVMGRTTEGRPMHSMHLGSGGTRTLVIAGLDGTDRIAVQWLEQLADALISRPALLRNNEVVFFRAGNPDGLVHKVKENARGVPLNRNFPSRRYRPTAELPSFAVPAGEVETRVMLDTLYTFRPRRVIHLTTTSARSHVIYNRSAKGLATELERSAKLRLVPLDAEHCPGSIEDFADGTLEAAVLSMKLATGHDWKQAWTELQPRILSAVVGRPVDPADVERTETRDPDRTPIPAASIEPVSRHPHRRGYEELPPPPQ